MRGAYELSYLSNDYLFHPEEQRQNIQWDSRYAVLSGDISRLSVDTPEQQMLVDRITANKNRLHDVYTQSVVAIEASKTKQGQPIDPELIDVAWSRFVVQNQAMIFDASHLSQLLKEESDYLQYVNTVLIFLLMVFLLLFLLTNYVFIKRRILQSISAINDGTKIIGKGNLDFRLDTHQDDEIGDLSVAFNQMTANLSEITASKFDLENEFIERKKVEDALRDARDNLEIQVQERTVQLTGANKDLQHENFERKRVEDALRKSEEKYRNIFENAIIGIYQTTPDGHLINANMAMARIFGYENPEDLLAEIHNITEQVYANPDDRKEVIRILKEHGVLEHYEVPAKQKQGTKISVSITARSVKDANGNLVFYEGTMVDITKSKRAEEAIQHNLEEKEVLLREIHHRVKNNLAGIIAIINLQIGTLTDPVNISQFKELETRIRSMALVHESLYLTKDLARIDIATYTDNLIRNLSQVYGTDTGVRFRIDMGDVTMPIETATPCGLVINEIITNSLKYAFPKTFSCTELRGEPCTIMLTMHREDSNYILNIADNGIGIPKNNGSLSSSSLGIFLIGFIVKHQLRGTVEINNKDGTAYTIRFPELKAEEGNCDEKI